MMRKYSLLFGFNKIKSSFRTGISHMMCHVKVNKCIFVCVGMNKILAHMAQIAADSHNPMLKRTLDSLLTKQCGNEFHSCCPLDIDN